MRIAAIIFALIFCTKIYAQTTKMNKIHELLSLTQEHIGPTVMKPMRHAIQHPKADSLFWAEVTKEFLTEISRLAAPVYDSYFTENEIDELLAFHRSPIGRKMLELAPVINETLMTDIQISGANLINRIQDKLKER